ncbi:MAG: hypothetical protein IJS15_03185, partial [Victivallales bacterium]|nr:hypothetical protein [Victivallales bacterium]
NRVHFDASKYADSSVAQEGNGWLEGSPVPAPDGTIRDLIRMHLSKPNKAGMLSLSNEGKELSFDYSDGIIDFVGGASRFTVRRDPKTGIYVTFSNPIDLDKDGNPITIRNILSMAVSHDLRH